jgi:hypothetical protein
MCCGATGDKQDDIVLVPVGSEERVHGAWLVNTIRNTPLAKTRTKKTGGATKKAEHNCVLVNAVGPDGERTMGWTQTRALVAREEVLGLNYGKGHDLGTAVTTPVAAARVHRLWCAALRKAILQERPPRCCVAQYNMAQGNQINVTRTHP